MKHRPDTFPFSSSSSFSFSSSSYSPPMRDNRDEAGRVNQFEKVFVQEKSVTTGGIETERAKWEERQ